jgi:GNAT superfamily N-acetyltransferase
MSTTLKIRNARSQDVGACVAILNAWIDETDWMPRVHSHGAVADFYKQIVFQQRKLFVAETAGQIGGMMVLADDSLVSALYVGASFRNRGIGSHLIDRAKQELNEPVQLWTFQANVEAQKFYLHHGFVEVNRTDGDNEEGLPDILFEWRAP